MGNHQKDYKEPKGRPLSQPRPAEKPHRKLGGVPSMDPAGPKKRLTK